MCGALSFENHSEMRRTEPRDREGAVDPKVFSDTGSRSTGIGALQFRSVCLMPLRPKIIARSCDPKAKRATELLFLRPK